MPMMLSAVMWWVVDNGGIRTWVQWCSEMEARPPINQLIRSRHLPGFHRMRPLRSSLVVLPYSKTSGGFDCFDAPSSRMVNESRPPTYPRMAVTMLVFSNWARMLFKR